MNDLESVSILLRKLKNGDEYASNQLWNRYIGDLIEVARNKLRNLPTRVSDEEDLVLAAFNAFFMGVRSNRFSKLNTRDDLWQVLVMLTERKAIDEIRQHSAQKRGQGKVRGESVFGKTEMGGKEPTPEFSVQFADEVQQCLGKLKDKDLTKIVMLRLQGYNNQEIAHHIERSVSSVERKMRLIRNIWNS